ncbi:MAG: hypothetical protein LAT63_07300 [Marinobacter sp.]|nr:hypothetical protein [Marinobacter sp.]
MQNLNKRQLSDAQTSPLSEGASAHSVGHLEQGASALEYIILVVVIVAAIVLAVQTGVLDGLLDAFRGVFDNIDTSGG